MAHTCTLPQLPHIPHPLATLPQRPHTARDTADPPLLSPAVTPPCRWVPGAGAGLGALSGRPLAALRGATSIPGRGGAASNHVMGTLFKAVARPSGSCELGGAELRARPGAPRALGPARRSVCPPRAPHHG